MAKVKAYENENIESLVGRFRRKCKSEGIQEEIKKREYYVGPSKRRSLKREEHQKQMRIAARRREEHRLEAEAVNREIKKNPAKTVKAQ